MFLFINCAMYVHFGCSIPVKQRSKYTPVQNGIKRFEIHAIFPERRPKACVWERKEERESGDIVSEQFRKTSGQSHCTLEFVRNHTHHPLEFSGFHSKQNKMTGTQAQHVHICCRLRIFGLILWCCFFFLASFFICTLNMTLSYHLVWCNASFSLFVLLRFRR